MLTLRPSSGQGSCKFLVYPPTLKFRGQAVKSIEEAGGKGKGRMTRKNSLNPSLRKREMSKWDVYLTTIFIVIMPLYISLRRVV